MNHLHANMFAPPDAGLTPAQAWHRLSRRQQRFVAYYMSMPNAAEAARKAGYSRKGAKVQGCRLLARPDIQAALRIDGSQGARLLALSYLPEELGHLVKDATDDSLRVLDRARAGRLLMEIAGFLKQRRGRRA